MNICVFCASSPQVSERFKEEARVIGRYIAEKGHTLVYGGATGGLMDAVAEAAHEGGAEIIGVIPEVIMRKGRESGLSSRLFRVGTMEERKDMMKEYADVFVALPGGYGTLDEVFDVLASGMAGEHDKPLVLVNTDDYWGSLLQQFQKMHAEGLAYRSPRVRLTVVQSADEAVREIEENLFAGVQ